jgi:hypothetical protein
MLIEIQDIAAIARYEAGHRKHNALTVRAMHQQYGRSFFHEVNLGLTCCCLE